MLSHVWLFAQVGHLKSTEVLGNLFNMSKHQLHKHTAGLCTVSEGLVHLGLESSCPCL